MALMEWISRAVDKLPPWARLICAALTVLLSVYRIVRYGFWSFLLHAIFKPVALRFQTVQAMKSAIQNPPAADRDFVKRALADIPWFCMYLETALGLKEKSPRDFDPQWLTREGLAASRGQFEEFLEEGSWSVFLARDPEKYSSTLQPTSPEDRSLSFGIGMFEHDALFRDL